MVAIFAALASLFPHSDNGLTPVGFKGEGHGLTPFGLQTEAFSKAVLEQVDFANKAWAEQIESWRKPVREFPEHPDVTRLRRLSRIDERIERIARDPTFGNNSHTHLRAEDADALGQNFIEQRIEHCPDAPAVSEPAPSLSRAAPVSRRYDRGYVVAPGVVDDPPDDPPVYLIAPPSPVSEAAPVQRKFAAYAAGVNLPGKATDWLKGIGACVVLALTMRWAMRNRVRAALFILGGPLATAALWFYAF